MKYSNIPFLFTLILSVLLINGCASTGATPSSKPAVTDEAPASAAPATEAKPAAKKKAAAPEAEPECD